MSYNYLPRLEEYNELVHKKIHQGKYFTAFSVGQLGAGASLNMYLETNSTNFIHTGMPELGISSEIVHVTAYRGGTVTGGVDIDVVNQNENSDRLTSLTTLKGGVTIVTPGVKKIKEFYLIGGNKIPATSKSGFETILKANQGYILTMENLGNSSIYFTFEMSWYETTDNYPYDTPNEY